jgi:predicted metal-dependent hydrolase
VNGPAGRDEALTGFLAHYAAGRFFDAHEVLEGAWRRGDDPEMRFLQGLIQWAVALEHHRRGNAHGARALLDRAIANLAAGPPGSMGLDLSACRAASPRMRRAFAAWEAGAGRPRLGVPPIVRAAEGTSRT